MKLLDLFCGAGGASAGYASAGFDVTGVDLNPQPNYPFTFHQADALTFDLSGYDVIHASPPCQAYSTKTPDPSRHRELIAPIRERLMAAGVPYIIENVGGARWAMHDPIRLCGSMFGLDVLRHRLFESDVDLDQPACNHKIWTPRFRVYDHGKWYLSRTVPVFGEGGGKAREHWGPAMGIDWMTDPELAEAIPPRYTEHVGRNIMQALQIQVAD